MRRWSERRGSNPRPTAPKAVALPTALLSGGHGRIRTRTERILNPPPLPLGYMPLNVACASGGIRTPTEGILSPMTLPLVYGGVKMVDAEGFEPTLDGF